MIVYLGVLFLSPSTVLHILIDVCGDYFSTSRMCSASCTSELYLRVWGGDPRHTGGAPVLDVRSFFCPARPQNGLGQVETPGKAKNKLQQNCLARINQVNGAASRVSLLSAIGF